jgi:tRNA-splicing ligase RtcB (3'-phosphate/5'-hydroxy nucleic acid ligase)
VTGQARLELVYDVSHDLAKLEHHRVHGQRRLLCVHRKGEFAATGQPVLVPGSMGTASWVLAGVPDGGAFFSACHGAGQRMSRHQARRLVRGP